MSNPEKLYNFSVPTVIYAIRRVFIYAESLEEAKEKLEGADWNDCDTDEIEAEHNFAEAILDEVHGDEEEDEQ